MNSQQARDAVIAAVTLVAPELDASSLEGSGSLRQQADLDSMDFLDFLTQIAETTGVDVPEDDYGEWETLDGAVAYLVAHG